MKYVDEYRDPLRVRRHLDAIERLVTRPWTVMELCGGQTHAIVRHGIDRLLPDSVKLVHGPGCPVCVTPTTLIDAAVDIALRPDVIFASFGDMARVPGTHASLLQAKARGADLRLVYSPLDALALARENPDRDVVFFAVGFETTAPTTAMAAHRAKLEGLANFSMLVAHVRVPPAMETILASPACAVQGFLAAGHVCAITGIEEYHPIAERHQVPIVITGFEPVDILHGLEFCLRQLEEGRAEVENPYARVVVERGNMTARDIVARVFRVVHRKWRGIGEIPASGLAFAPDYVALDAACRFGLVEDVAEPVSECIAGAVLQGQAKPVDCPAFGTRCTPNHPLGAPMVSSEGACAAYHAHRRRARAVPALGSADAPVVRVDTGASHP